MQKIKYGIIGGSRIALRHLKALASLKNFYEIKAISSRSLDNCKKIVESIKEYGFDVDGIQVYDNYIEMLEKEDLDIVDITTESGRHRAITIDCLAHGTNVLVEKPMAVTLDDCDAMINTAKEKGLKLFVSQQMRFSPSVMEVKKALDGGKFGKLLHSTVHIRWNRNKAYYEQAAWRGTKEQDGGTLLNQCIHSIDILRWLMGSEPVEVFAYTDNMMHPEIEIEDVGLALIKFKNGAYATIEGTVNVYPKNYEETLFVFGEKGTVKLGGKSLDTIEHWNVENEKEPEVTKYDDTALSCYIKLFENIASCITGNDEPMVSGFEARKTMELIHAIYKSAEKGVPVKL